MVKMYEKIQQNDIPSLNNNELSPIISRPIPMWNANNSFDYKQYLQKKIGLNMYRHARSLNSENSATCKADENFKLSFQTKNVSGEINEIVTIYKYTDYQTMIKLFKTYKFVHPYCQFNTNPIPASTTVNKTGEQIKNANFTLSGIESSILQNLRLDTTTTDIITPIEQNKVKGNMPINKQCVGFKHGFILDKKYRFKMN